MDISESDGRNAFDDLIKINTELNNYSEELGKLPQIIVLSKCDILDEQTLNEKIKSFEEKCRKNSKGIHRLCRGYAPSIGRDSHRG